MLHTQLAALALGAIVLAVSGCGGSSKSETTSSAATTTTAAATTTASATTPTTPTVKLATGKPLTRTQWIVKGDKICAHVNAVVATISVRTAAEYAHFLPQVAAYYSNEATDLGKLTPPPAMAGDAEKLVGGIQLLGESLGRAGEAYQAGNVESGGQLFRTALAVQKQPIAVAKRDGFKKCIEKN